MSLKAESPFDWKRRHADESAKALEHKLVKNVIDEQVGNILRNGDRPPPEGLLRYGLNKIAHVAAQVARAQAIGLDPSVLRLTKDEARDAILSTIKRWNSPSHDKVNPADGCDE